MKTILLADDEFDILEVMRLLLEAEGYRVVTAEDGRRVLQALEADPPDLLVLDVMMPRLSGLDVLKELRTARGLKELPVVLMSAVKPAVKQADYGWNAFLLKPFAIETLLKTVAGLVGGGQN